MLSVSVAAVVAVVVVVVVVVYAVHASTALAHAFSGPYSRKNGVTEVNVLID